MLESECHGPVLAANLLERDFEFAVCRKSFGIEENDLFLGIQVSCGNKMKISRQRCIFDIFQQGSDGLQIQL